MRVPFVDLKAQYLSIKDEVDSGIFNVINETAFIGGKYVQNFEREFAEKYGVKHCISVANGTDSLYIIMKMLGIGPGDEVICVANSWISSSETITQTGAKVVFVDIDPVFYTIDENLIEHKITKCTKAIIPVHLFGQMCEMGKILDLANRYSLYVIEDCAQSHFSEYNGRRAGTIGDAGSFSFYPGKNFGAYGDAGCIVTNDDELAEKFRIYSHHGAKVKHNHLIEGINSRMDGIQAAVLSKKLPYIIDWNKSRIENAAYYTKLLEDIPEVICPSVRKKTTHTFHLYVVKVEYREQLVQYLDEQGIETAIHYPTSLPFLTAYDYLNHQSDHFPVSFENQSKILSLPMYPELTQSAIKFIAESISSFYKGNG